MSKLPRIVVFGGSGFLGTQVCKAAASRQWHVTSVSRSGEPDWSSSISSSNNRPTKPSWASSVNWAKANIFDPTTYQQHLQDADAVVHSMGILLEMNYKGLLKGQLPTSSSAATSSNKPDDGNPLKKTEGNTSTTATTQPALTYESMNRDSAITLANVFASTSTSSTPSQSPTSTTTTKKKTFLYVSAAAGFPLLPHRYISTKRQAEVALSNMKDLRTIAIRPGFIYSPERKVTVPLSGLVSLSSMVNGMTKGVFSPLLGAAAYAPLKAEDVGRAVVQAIEDGTVEGVIESDGIMELAGRSLRG